MKVFTFNKDYGKTRDLPMYLFMLALLFSYITVLWRFPGLLISSETEFLPCSLKYLTQQLSKSSQPPPPLLFLLKGDNLERSQGCNYSLPGLHWIEHLPYGGWTVWKKKKVKKVIHCFCKGEKWQQVWMKDLSEDSGKSKLKIAAQKSISLVLRCYRMRWEADVSSDRPAIWSRKFAA